MMSRGRQWFTIQCRQASGTDPEDDCGYPNSIELPDGKILTAFYSKSAANYDHCHMGVAIWTPTKAESR